MRCAVVVLGLMVSPAAATADPLVAATVVDGRGPVAGATIRLVSLAPAPCPCPLTIGTIGYPWGLPTCSCPAALASWHDRLARCASPVSTAPPRTSDPHGRVVLRPGRDADAIEVTSGDRIAWVARPRTLDPIAIELAPAQSPRVYLRAPAGAALHGAVLFGDGHCVPLVPDGDEWRPSVPVPSVGDASAVLFVEAQGFAPLALPWRDDDLASVMRPPMAVEGTCRGDRVRFENQVQDLSVPVGAGHRFSIAGVQPIGGKATCWKGARLVRTWDYLPADGLTRAPARPTRRACTILVAGDDGQPIAGASIATITPVDGLISFPDTLATTDARGCAIVERLAAGDQLIVGAPPAAGGACAGETRVPLTRTLLRRSPLRVHLPIGALAPVARRGRVVDRGNVPVPGARVVVFRIAATPTCSVTVDGLGGAGIAEVTTGLDGAFTLAPLPAGTATIEVTHRYQSRQLDLVDGAPATIVLAR